MNATQATLFDNQALDARDPTAVRELVCDLIRRRAHYGADDAEIASELSLAPETARARRVELVAAGDVVASGRERAGRRGEPMPVWIVAGQAGTFPRTAGGVCLHRGELARDTTPHGTRVTCCACGHFVSYEPKPKPKLR